MRDVPVGTPVYTITGGRSVALYDGATLLDTYTSVTSLYSLLTQIRDGSDIRYTGAIAADRSPGGMGCDDLTYRPHRMSPAARARGTVYMQRANVPLTVAAGAPSETLTVTCLAAPILAPRSGRYAARSAGAWTMRTRAMPTRTVTMRSRSAPVAAGPDPAGRQIGVPRTAHARRAGTTPVLCIKDFVLGAEAGQESFEFVWTPRPADDCDCTGTGVPDTWTSAAGH